MTTRQHTTTHHSTTQRNPTGHDTPKRKSHKRKACNGADPDKQAGPLTIPSGGEIPLRKRLCDPEKKLTPPDSILKVPTKKIIAPKDGT